MRITGIRLDRLTVPLDPPFPAAWDPVPRTSFAVTVVRVETDAGVVCVGSGDTMDGFEAYEHLFLDQDPLAIARHVRALETIDFHAGRYWPLEAALWDVAGQVAGLPVATFFGGATDGIPAYASCGMLLPPGERAESALRLREEGFRAMKIRIDPQRLEEILGIAVERKTRWHDPDDRVRTLVDSHRLTDGCRTAAEMAFPEAIAQNDDVRRLQSPFTEGAADRRLDTDDVEEVRGDDFSTRGDNFIAGAERKALIGERRHRFKAPILFLPVDERRIRDAIELQRSPRFGREDHHQLRRLGER
jgi:hypothetical protein